MQFPIWVWFALVVGVIAAGIGLGYLIIYLFWRIERYFSPAVAVHKKVEPEIKVEEPVVDEMESSFTPEITIPQKAEPDIQVEEPAAVEEELVTNIKDAGLSERNRLIKFTYILNSQFNKLFEEADTIICWDLSLRNGDEVWDVGGKQMKMQVNRIQSKTERVKYTLADESGHHTISVIPAKEYLERETKLNFDKLRVV